MEFPARDLVTELRGEGFDVYLDTDYRLHLDYKTPRAAWLTPMAVEACYEIQDRVKAYLLAEEYVNTYVN